MIEDDVYRTSTQYRYWSYTPQQLAELRRQTNELASEKVRAAFRRAHRSRNGGTTKTDGEGMDDDTEIEVATLTVKEELKIVEWGCRKIVEMGEAMRPRVPGGVVATAIQYLRRFYLTNSPMTYHPKSTMLCCLFLACKSDHFYLSLRRFIDGVDPDGSSGVTEDDVKAPEFLLLQGLRFTLEVRHPMRGLMGGVADMGRMVREGVLSVNEGEKGVGRAAERVKGVLKGEAQMTDVYFLWTPSQVWLGGLLAVDEDLARRYLDAKFEELGDKVEEGVREKVMHTVKACAEMLMAYKSPEDDKASRKEMSRIGKKLIACQNPEKVDIVAVAKAKAAEKREGDESEAEMKKKKRKVEREKAAMDGDVFGPNLKSVG